MLQINTLTRLDLGVKQENLARDLYIDMSAWISEYPNGTITVWHKRNGDETKYAVGGATFDRETNILKWTPTEYDTFYTGQGLCEIRLTENDVIKKTKDIVTETAKSLMLGSGETLEAGWQNLVNTISGYASDAEDAQTAAEDAQDAAEDAQQAAEDARDAAQAATVHEPTIDEDSGNWLVWSQDDGEYVDTGVHAQGPQGEPGSIENVRATGIKMSMVDDTTVYDAIQDRANKVTGGTENNFAALDANGNLKDSGSKASDFLTEHQDITGKADKVTGGTENNFAALDANGNLKDSGHKHGDYLTSHQDISGKADKVSSATSGNFAGLDANGNLTDSGKKASDFAAASATLRDVPFSVTTSDWTLSSGVYVAEYTTAYATTTCKYTAYYDGSIRSYATDDIYDELKSGGGGIKLTTASLPTGTISGIFRIFDTDDGKVPVIIEDTTVAIANGGTGASSASGARTNLGLGDAAVQGVANDLNQTAAGKVLDARQGKALDDKITTVNSNLNSEDHWSLCRRMYISANSSIDITVPDAREIYVLSTPSSGSPCFFCIGNGVNTIYPLFGTCSNFTATRGSYKVTLSNSFSWGVLCYIFAPFKTTGGI